MISRVWHGWTTPANANQYETFLKGEIFPGIKDRQIQGLREIQLFRRNSEQDVEFVIVMWFDSLASIRDFAGQEYEVAVVSPKGRSLLSRFDARSQHYVVAAEVKN
jgi:heme-degrading monooxygenase HmoA